MQGLLLAGLLPLVLGYMGLNAGATFTYHLHLLVPLMFIVGAGALRGRRELRLLCILGMMLCIRREVMVLRVPDASHGYERLHEILKPYHDVLGVPFTIHVQASLHQRVYYNGNTAFMTLAYQNDGDLARPEPYVFRQKYEGLVQEIQTNLRECRFELVLLLKGNTVQPFDASLVPQNYIKDDEEVPIPAYFDLDARVEIWRPRR